MNLADDDSSGSEFVPNVEDDEVDEDERDTKKRKQEAEVELMDDAELDDLWAEMTKKPSVGGGGGGVGGGGVNAVKKQEEKKIPSSGATASTGGGVDISKLLAEISSSSSTQTNVETVRFAGQDVHVEVVKEKEDGIKKAMQALKGKTKSVTTLDKSALDWESMKREDDKAREELEQHLKGRTYLEKVSFLKRAELREYELERDAKK